MSIQSRTDYHLGNAARSNTLPDGFSGSSDFYGEDILGIHKTGFVLPELGTTRTSFVPKAIENECELLTMALNDKARKIKDLSDKKDKFERNMQIHRLIQIVTMVTGGTLAMLYPSNPVYYMPFLAMGIGASIYNCSNPMKTIQSYTDEMSSLTEESKAIASRYSSKPKAFETCKLGDHQYFRKTRDS